MVYIYHEKNKTISSVCKIVVVSFFQALVESAEVKTTLKKPLQLKVCLPYCYPLISPQGVY